MEDAVPANGGTPEGSGDTAKEAVSATDALEGHNILLNPPDRNPSTAFQRIHHLSSPVAVDIGGTLAKMAYFRPSNPIPRNRLPSYIEVENHFYTAGQLPVKPDKSLEIDLSTNDGSIGGVLKFLKFPSTSVVQFVDFILANKLVDGYGHDNLKTINATGGGAYKYADIVREKLGISFVPQDEMRSMIMGLNFLIHNTKKEIFTYKDHKQKFVDCTKFGSECYPYLLVSCGSGVSVIRVDGHDEFERVSGSAIGGATFYGLCRMLTGLNNFDDVQKHGKKGDHTKVDLLVGDIYGGDYPQFGLQATRVASSFGKAAGATQVIKREEQEDESTPTQSPSSPVTEPLFPPSARTSFSNPHHGSAEEVTSGDIVQSLMFMVCSNIAQLAYLNATHQNVNIVFFTGGFVRDNALLWNKLSESISYWSKGKMKAHFVMHDGYLGALGSLIYGSAPDPGEGDTK